MVARPATQSNTDQGASLILGLVLGMIIAGGAAVAVGGWQLWRESVSPTPTYAYPTTVAPPYPTTVAPTTQSYPYYQPADTQWNDSDNPQPSPYGSAQPVYSGYPSTSASSEPNQFQTPAGFDPYSTSSGPPQPAQYYSSGTTADSPAAEGKTEGSDEAMEEVPDKEETGAEQPSPEP